MFVRQIPRDSLSSSASRTEECVTGTVTLLLPSASFTANTLFAGFPGERTAASVFRSALWLAGKPERNFVAEAAEVREI